MEDVVVASDLVGCRYRLVQRRAHPEIPRTRSSIARAERHSAAVDAVMELFPRKAPGHFRRIDLEGDDWERAMATLEAIASFVGGGMCGLDKGGDCLVEAAGIVAG